MVSLERSKSREIMICGARYLDVENCVRQTKKI